MFETLLKLIATQGTSSRTELARRLEVSNALLDQMLDELMRQGYLRAVVQGQTASCEHCSVKGACTTAQQAQLLVLTPKGERLLIKRSKGGAV